MHAAWSHATVLARVDQSNVEIPPEERTLLSLRYNAQGASPWYNISKLVAELARLELTLLSGDDPNNAGRPNHRVLRTGVVCNTVSMSICHGNKMPRILLIAWSGGQLKVFTNTDATTYGGIPSRVDRNNEHVRRFLPLSRGEVDRHSIQSRFGRIVLLHPAALGRILL
jgi:hypothetical protein